MKLNKIQTNSHDQSMLIMKWLLMHDEEEGKDSALVYHKQIQMEPLESQNQPEPTDQIAAAASVWDDLSALKPGDDSTGIQTNFLRQQPDRSLTSNRKKN